MDVFLFCLSYVSLIGGLVWAQKYIIPSELYNIYNNLFHTFSICVISWYVLVTLKKFLNYKKVSPINKSVLITGCDTGFGHALAKKLDSKGFKVFAGCLFPSGDGAKSLRETCSSSFHVLGLDVTKDENVKDAVNYVQNNLNGTKLWAIVNNAGVVRIGPFELLTKQDIQIQMAVNAMGVVNVTRSFLPLIRRDKGRIINLTSAAGRVTAPHAIGYFMSKHAASAFSECLRQEIRPWGIKVITIEPEFFRTSMSDHRTFSVNFENSLMEAEENIKEEYGLDYIQQFETSMCKLLQFSSNKIFKVIDALEDAVCLEEPCDVYKPARNIFFSFIMYTLKLFPKPIVDIMLRYGSYIFKFSEVKI